MRARNGGIVSVLALGLVAACSDGHLRGTAEPSPDGKTYLAIVDDNGGQCGSITLDGGRWPHPIGVYAEIEPGIHTIACGGEIAFDVPPGARFAFDYWGP